MQGFSDRSLFTSHLRNTYLHLVSTTQVMFPNSKSNQIYCPVSFRMQAAAFFQTQLPNKHTEDNEAQFTCSYSFIGQNAVASQSSRLPLHRAIIGYYRAWASTIGTIVYSTEYIKLLFPLEARHIPTTSNYWCLIVFVAPMNEWIYHCATIHHDISSIPGLRCGEQTTNTYICRRF